MRQIPIALVAVTVILAVVAGGCSLAPQYQRPEMPAPQTWDSTAAVPAAPTAPAERQPADIPWQELFTDPQLRSLVELALDNNRDLRMAGLTVDRLRAAYRIERARRLPTVAASADAEIYRVPADLSSTDSAQTISQYSVSLGTAGWEIDFFGRLRSLKESALEQYLASQEARAAAQISLVAGVASAYLALAADTESLTLAEATLTAQEAAFELIRQSSELGMTGELELRQAQSQVEAARVEKARLSGQVALDRNALTLLVGAPVPQALLPSSLAAVAQESVVPPGLSSEVLLNRPDILMAEHRLKAANANIGAARAAFYPRISLTAAGGTLSSELTGLFGSGSEAWRFVPNISVPIFTGGALHAGLEVAEVERDLAVAEYERSIQSAFREVADALALQETLREQQAAQESLAAALEQSYELALARYNAGIDGYLNVLVAERSLYAARQGLVAIRMANQANLVTLLKVLGCGGMIDAAPETTAVDTAADSATAGEQG